MAKNLSAQNRWVFKTTRKVQSQMAENLPFKRQWFIFAPLDPEVIIKVEELLKKNVSKTKLIFQKSR